MRKKGVHRDNSDRQREAFHGCVHTVTQSTPFLHVFARCAQRSVEGREENIADGVEGKQPLPCRHQCRQEPVPLSRPLS
ncbi:hypothetical protein ACOMHN_013070 [Nucella lapillus]